MDKKTNKLTSCWRHNGVYKQRTHSYWALLCVAYKHGHFFSWIDTRHKQFFSHNQVHVAYHKNTSYQKLWFRPRHPPLERIQWSGALARGAKQPATESCWADRFLSLAHRKVLRSVTRKLRVNSACIGIYVVHGVWCWVKQLSVNTAGHTCHYWAICRCHSATELTVDRIREQADFEWCEVRRDAKLQKKGR